MFNKLQYISRKHGRGTNIHQALDGGANGFSFVIRITFLTTFTLAEAAKFYVKNI
jgi:hypothetical protein